MFIIVVKIVISGSKWIRRVIYIRNGLILKFMKNGNNIMDLVS